MHSYGSKNDSLSICAIYIGRQGVATKAHLYLEMVSACDHK